jgi:hypothetical protein
MAAMAEFFREYFRYDRAPDVNKDEKAFPFHSPADLVADTDLWVRDVVSVRMRVLATLLTSGNGYVRPRTAPSYSLSPITPASAPPRAVELPAGQRSGILTQPSFLVAFSENDQNDPIRRGKWIQQSLLCGSLPDTIPANVPPLPELPNSTLRERLAAHRTLPGCVACHALMDPLGLALEGYDHVGRIRSSEQGRPVDTRGEFIGTGTAIDGPFNGARELAQRLASSGLVEQCFVRHSFRYWYGRNESDADGCALAAAQAAYERSEGDVFELLVALLTSDSFVFRI